MGLPCRGYKNCKNTGLQGNAILQHMASIDMRTALKSHTFFNPKAKNHGGAPFCQMPRILLSSWLAEKPFLTEFKHPNIKIDKKSTPGPALRRLRPAEVS